MECYEGTSNFIFISYSHKDSAFVESVISELQKNHIRVWYDLGIHSGVEWRDYIAQRIIDCRLVIPFLSKNSLASPDCLDEISYARTQMKEMIPVRLEKVDYPKGLEMFLHRVQHITDVSDAKAVARKILESEAAQKCKEPEKSEEKKEDERGYGFIRFQSGGQKLPENWGPERPVFKQGEFPQYVTFNSQTDHPEYGDERYFVSIREADRENAEWLRSVSLEAGKEYEVRISYHNNCDPALNHMGSGIANKVVLQVSVPDVIIPNRMEQIKATIFAVKSKPSVLWAAAGVSAASTSPIFLRWVMASARIHNQGQLNGRILPVHLFTNSGNEGTFLGYNEPDGWLPAGDEFGGCVTFRFQAFQPQVVCVMKRSASVNGGKYTRGSVVAHPGDTVAFRNEFRNAGNLLLSGVTFKDDLGGGLALVGNTTNYSDSVGDTIHLGDAIDKNGYNFGTYGAGVSVTIDYETTVPQNAVPGTFRTISHIYHNGGGWSNALDVTIE